MKKLIIVFFIFFIVIVLSVIFYFVFCPTPKISLLNPADRSVFKEGSVDIAFIIDKFYSFNNIKSCTLYLNSQPYKKIEKVPENLPQNVHLDNLQNKEYDWKISCTSNVPLLEKGLFTETRRFFVISNPIELLEPADGKIFEGDLTTFNFLLKEDYLFQEIDSCALYLNNNIFKTELDIVRGIPKPFQIGNLKDGKYKWKISCTENEDFVNPETFTSEERKFYTLTLFNKTNISSCIDLDEERNYYIKGDTIISDQRHAAYIYTATDYCDTSDPNNLDEYFCYTFEDGSRTLARAIIECPNGCNDGACIKPDTK